MEDVSITPAGPGEIPLLDSALRQLAADLGDAYLSDEVALEAALCGEAPRCLALLATRRNAVLGAVLASPAFSTMRGGVGLFVSDLWVAASARNQGLARRLLAAALREGVRRGSGAFLKLSVYHDNPTARASYDRLGFTAQSGETNMVLTGHALDNLMEGR